MAIMPRQKLHTAEREGRDRERERVIQRETNRERRTNETNRERHTQLDSVHTVETRHNKR
jgi:hypothetical protein